MQWLRNSLVILLVALWLPASVHCQIESLTGLEFLACTASPDGPANTPTSHCETGCCSIEQGQCQAEQPSLRIALPASLLVGVAPPLKVATALPDATSLGILRTEPPPSLTTWHFAFRTALPARAPSQVS